MRKPLALVTSLLLLCSMAPASAASKSSNQWSVTQKIYYVALTPSSEPNFWTSQSEETLTAEGDMLVFAKTAVSNATAFWKRASNDGLKFGSPKFFVGKPGTSVRRCNNRADIQSAMKIAGLKTIPVGVHLVVANISDTCGYAGIGAQGGNTVILKSLGTSTLTHELGHNFGYLHSASMFCEKSDYSKFNAKNCSIDEYGDFRDLMGNDEWCPNATLSASQRATVFGVPLAKDIKVGQTYTVDESRSKSTNLVYQMKYKGTWYFFEYSNPGRDRCMTVSNISYSPEIQVRMIGPDWLLDKSGSAGPVIISRRESDLPAPVIPTEVNGMVMLPPYGGWTLRGFKAGEKFQLPGTNLSLVVLTTESATATFTITQW